MDFLPVRCDESGYLEYIRLFSVCFPRSKKYNLDYLDWLYRRNPDGQVVGFDARDGGRLAAHYVCIPVYLYVGGRSVKALLSLNTATHPNYQGKGLFTKLAEYTYAAGADLGYECVYGVANANSTPGFTRKLNFQLICPLLAKVGVGRPGIDLKYLTSSAQFRRSWSPAALDWRCASPMNPVLSCSEGFVRTFFAPALLGGACSVTAMIDHEGPSAMSPSGAKRFASPVHLFIGCIPRGAQRTALYVDIPERFRPSPLNLIYRSLLGSLDSIEADSVFLNFLDFDAY